MQFKLELELEKYKIILNVSAFNTATTLQSNRCECNFIYVTI